MLAWLFRHVPLLRLIPGLPPLFDTFLLAWTALFHPKCLAALHQIEQTVLAWPGVTVKIHRFGGTEFNLGRNEIGHLHGHGLLDIPFTNAIRDEVVSAGQAQPHHIFSRSAWVSYSIRSEADVPGAIRLLRRSYERRKKSDSGQV